MCDEQVTASISVRGVREPPLAGNLSQVCALGRARYRTATVSHLGRCGALLELGDGRPGDVDAELGVVVEFVVDDPQREGVAQLPQGGFWHFGYVDDGVGELVEEFDSVVRRRWGSGFEFLEFGVLGVAFGGQSDQALLDSVEDDTGGVVALFESVEEAFQSTVGVGDGASETLDFVVVGAGAFVIVDGDGGGEQFASVGTEDVGVEELGGGGEEFGFGKQDRGWVVVGSVLAAWLAVVVGVALAGFAVHAFAVA
ncbi:hypothetical protein [Nocardia mangyaensis]|uniref:hypothetical protein n=1 Tax=Nocardia mangyaensis TaxID=2213200 RepID=UPI002676847E|nr:hypothetical protein [Nocardia mangyaensis]MDO3650446.1 hypothetical protein [Nocardia mangyaensis]